MDKYDKVFELAKNRGFIWPSFEIYGGASGFYDYGPLGATLKRKIEDVWRKFYCVGEGFYEIEAPTIGVEAIFEASGHVGGFADPMTTCEKCKESFRADHIIKGQMEIPDGLSKQQMTEIIHKHNIKCPECGGPLGDGARLVEVDEPHIEVSAVEPRGDGHVDVRLVNLGAEPRRVRVRWSGAAGHRLGRVDLAGNLVPGQTQEGVTDGIQLDLGPWRIETLRASRLTS